MKECVKIKKILSRYIDKEAGSADAALVEAHLAGCPPCSKELADLIRIKLFALGMERKALPQDYFIYRLGEAISNERATRGRFSLAAMAGFARKLIPVPVAAIALSIAFLILSSRDTGGYSFEDHIFSGTQTTADTALELIFGMRN